MKTAFHLPIFFLFSFVFVNYQSSAVEIIVPQEVYKSESMVVMRISENAYIHTSFLQTNDFGLVPCNCLEVIGGKVDFYPAAHKLIRVYPPRRKLSIASLHLSHSP